MKRDAIISKTLLTVVCVFLFSSCVVDDYYGNNYNYSAGVYAFQSLEKILKNNIGILEYALPLEQYIKNEAGDYQISEDKYFKNYKVRKVKDNIWCVLSGGDTLSVINTHGVSLFTPGTDWDIKQGGNAPYMETWQKLTYKGNGEWDFSPDNYICNYSWICNGSLEISINDFDSMTEDPAFLSDCSFSFTGDLKAIYYDIYYNANDYQLIYKERNRIETVFAEKVLFNNVIKEASFSFMLSDVGYPEIEKVDVLITPVAFFGGREIRIDYRGESVINIFND